MVVGMGNNSPMTPIPKQEVMAASSPVGEISPEDMAKHAGQAAQFLKLMANPNRLMVLCHLLDQELSVSELNEHLPLSQSALSQHLAVLRHAGLVTTRREQQVIYYSLASEEVREMISLLHSLFCDV